MSATTNDQQHPVATIISKYPKRILDKLPAGVCKVVARLCGKELGSKKAALEWLKTFWSSLPIFLVRFNVLSINQ